MALAGAAACGGKLEGGRAEAGDPRTASAEVRVDVILVHEAPREENAGANPGYSFAMVYASAIPPPDAPGQVREWTDGACELIEWSHGPDDANERWRRVEIATTAVEAPGGTLFEPRRNRMGSDFVAQGRVEEGSQHVDLLAAQPLANVGSAVRKPAAEEHQAERPDGDGRIVPEDERAGEPHRGTD